MSEGSHEELLSLISYNFQKRFGRNFELVDYIGSTSTQSELEINLLNGTNSLMIVNKPELFIRTLSDAKQFIAALQAAANYATKEAGITIYPIYEF